MTDFTASLKCYIYAFKWENVTKSLNGLKRYAFESPEFCFACVILVNNK